MAQFIIGNALGKTAQNNRLLQSTLWRLDYAMIWLLIKLFGLLPVDTASRMGNRLGRIIGPQLSRKTEMYRENLRRAFSGKSHSEIENLIVDCWGNAGRVLAEYPHFNKIHTSSDRQRLHIDVIQEFETQSNPERPAVFVGAHHCNWEVSMPALSRLGIPIAGLYSPPTNPLLDQMLYRSRRELNCELVTRDNAARDMVRHLKMGRSAGLIMDRRVDDNPDILFFGIPKPTSILPAKLAQKFGIDLIPVRVERVKDAEFTVTVYPPVIPRDKTANEEQQALDMMSQVHDHFQQWITEHPEEWFCPKRIWPKHAHRQNSPPEHREVSSYAV